MERLKWLRLQNFEAHSDTTIYFSKRKTVIVGDNDAGKTSIFLAWLFLNTNRPRGRSFIREGQKFCIVSAGFKTFVVEREVSKKVNCYRIIKENNIQVYDVIKDSVPAEIQEVLGFDKNSFQSQSEAAFFVLKPAGQVAQLLNKVTGIEDIQKVIAEINRRIRETKALYNDTLSAITETEHDLRARKFKKLGKYEWNLINRRNIIERITKDTKDSETLRASLEQYNENKFHLHNLRKYNIDLKIFDKVDQITQKIKKEQANTEKLNAMIDKIKKNAKIREGFVLPIKRDEKLFISLPTAVKEYKALSILVEKINGVIENQNIILKENEAAIEELKEISQEMDQCPLCNSVIDKDTFVNL